MARANRACFYCYSREHDIRHCKARLDSDNRNGIVRDADNRGANPRAPARGGRNEGRGGYQAPRPAGPTAYGALQTRVRAIEAPPPPEGAALAPYYPPAPQPEPPRAAYPMQQADHAYGYVAEGDNQGNA